MIKSEIQRNSSWYNNNDRITCPFFLPRFSFSFRTYFLSEGCVACSLCYIIFDYSNSFFFLSFFFEGSEKTQSYCIAAKKKKCMWQSYLNKFFAFLRQMMVVATWLYIKNNSFFFLCSFSFLFFSFCLVLWKVAQYVWRS